MPKVRAYSWLDWSDGWIEYLQAQSALEEETHVRPIHIGSVGSVHAGQRDNSEVYTAEALRTEWRSFVSDIVEPQLAIHTLRFVTLTFRDIHGNSPTLTRGRRELETFILNLRDEADAFVFVEERGKENARLHYHGCIRYNIMEYSQMQVMSLLSEWKRDNGFYKYEVPKKQASAIDYTVKYLVKGAYSGDTAFWAMRSTANTQILMELQ